MYLKKYRWILLPILLCFSVWLLFQTVLLVGVVPSSSMEPTIPEGNIILGTRVVGSLGRGDIIVFRHEGETLVKRIVAVGGDTASLNDQDGSFAVNQELATATRILIVPKDYFFVVGDNRQNSFDSRFWEEPFVGVKWVLARVRA